MVNKAIMSVYPPVKAIAAEDGTYLVAICPLFPSAGADTIFEEVSPPVKAVDNGDGTYLVKCELL